MYKILIALVALTLCSCGPTRSAELTKGSVAPPNAAATQSSVSNNAAVVEKGVNSTTITVPASSEPQQYHVDIKPLIDGLLPYIISAIGALITILGGVVATWLKQKWNVDIDQAHRDAWQQSAQNAAGALIAKGAVAVEENGKITVKSADMAHVIDVVMARVPDAIKHFGFTPDDIQHLIIAKIPQVLTGSSPAAGPSTVITTVPTKPAVTETTTTVTTTPGKKGK